MVFETWRPGNIRLFSWRSRRGPSGERKGKNKGDRISRVPYPLGERNQRSTPARRISTFPRPQETKTRVFSLILNEFVVACLLEVCLADRKYKPK